MIHLPRFAVGSVQSGVCHQAATWAVLDILEECGLHAQSFLSQARFPACDAVTTITGQGHRHLDSWLMSAELCQELFCRATQACDVAVVEGAYDSARRSPADMGAGGSLDTLCDWLGLPRLAIVDCSRLDLCSFPVEPGSYGGVILDGVADSLQAERIRTSLESIWQVPVFGYLDSHAPCRQEVRGLKGAPPSRELCRGLGRHLRASLDLPRFLEFVRSADRVRFSCGSFPEQLGRKVNIAVALDDAFQCYFQDVFELLEDRGAVLRDFSPLRDETIPCDADVLYLGCGRLDLHAAELTRNHCLKQSICRFVANGGRVYAEGSGLAYLSQYVVLADRQVVPMAGALPIVAFEEPHPSPPQPASIRLAKTTWLAKEATELRGYRNPRWQIGPLAPCESLAVGEEHRTDLLGRGNVLGSRLHLHFGAQTHMLGSFFRPATASCPGRRR